MRTSLLGRASMVCVATVLVCLPLAAAPASAHDALIGSTPADGAVLTTAPTSITLEFSDEVQNIAPALVLRDADDNVISEDEPSVDGNTVTDDVTDVLPNGEYSIVWRVVSVDGHPVQGVIDFAVKVPGTSGADTSAAPTPSAEQTTPAAAATSDDASRDVSGSTSPVVLVGVAVAAALVLAALAFVGVRARRS